MMGTWTRKQWKAVGWILLAVGVAGRGMAAPGQLQLVNGYAAVVNDRVITYEDVNSAIDPARIESLRLEFRNNPNGWAEASERLRSEALDNLIERELILEEFKQSGMQVPDDYIEGRIKEVIRKDFGDRTRLTQTLRAQGITMEAYRKQLTDNAIVGAMTDKYVDSGVLVSPYKIEKYYETHQDVFQVKDRVKLRMIYLGYRSDRDPAATRQLAGEILERIRGGAEFGEMASIYSDGSQRRKGGDWGWVDRETLRDDLAAIAFSLKAGDCSEVLEKSDGCYVMLVEEIEREHVKPLSEVRSEVEEVLKRQERARLREKWIEGLREKSFVFIFPLR